MICTSFILCAYQQKFILNQHVPSVTDDVHRNTYLKRKLNIRRINTEIRVLLEHGTCGEGNRDIKDFREILRADFVTEVRVTMN